MQLTSTGRGRVGGGVLVLPQGQVPKSVSTWVSVAAVSSLHQRSQESFVVPPFQFQQAL